MFERRLTFVYGAICIALMVLAFKIVKLQVLRISIEDPALVLHPPRPWKTIPAARGAILDRDGNILAADQPKLDLRIHYKNLRDPEYSLKPIQEVTGHSEAHLIEQRDKIIARVSGIREAVLGRLPRIRERIKSGKLKGWYVYEETIPHTIVSGVSLEVAARIQAAPDRFSGVSVETRLHREYPGGAMARHVIGRLGKAEREVLLDPSISPGDRIGISGIEQQYDSVLRGTKGLFSTRSNSRAFSRIKPDPLLGSVPGSVRMQIDEATHRLKPMVPIPAEPGCSIHLALHSKAQQRANEMLEKLEGAVVVMDVHNGELLVLASAPLNESGWSRAIQSTIPSGSVMKPLVALAAAAEGKVTPDTTINCDGGMQIGGHHRKCSHVHGATDMRKAISESCNVYFWKLGLRIGVTPIADMATKLGFGTPTGVDLPSERRGLVSRPRSPMNLSIGQGRLQVTPLQVTVAMAAIANGGKVLQPRLFLRTEARADPAHLPTSGAIPLRQIILDPSMLQAIREGMREAVVSGTVSIEPLLGELKVAAKTGTAQTGRPGVNHGWLAGYVPYDAPRYAFAVVVLDTPLSGAAAAGTITAEVLKVLLDAH